MTARAVGSPDGSSHRGSSPDHDGGRAREQAGLPKLRHHAVEPIRPLADFVEEQTRSPRADRTRTACRAMRAAASACRRTAARAPRRAGPSRGAGGASSPIGSRRHRARSKESRSYPSAPRPSRPASIGPWNATIPQLQRQERQERRQIAVSDEGLAGAPRLLAIEQRQHLRAAVSAAHADDAGNRRIAPGRIESPRRGPRADRPRTLPREDRVVVHGRRNPGGGAPRRRDRTRHARTGWRGRRRRGDRRARGRAA